MGTGHGPSGRCRTVAVVQGVTVKVEGLASSSSAVQGLEAPVLVALGSAFRVAWDLASPEERGLRLAAVEEKILAWAWLEEEAVAAEGELATTIAEQAPAMVAVMMTVAMVAQLSAVGRVALSRQAL